MPRPFAVIGFTVFFTLAFLFDMEIGVTIAVLIAFIAALVVALSVKNLRIGRVLPYAFAAGITACALLLSAEYFSYQPAVAYDGRNVNVQAVLTDNPEIKYGNYYYEVKASALDGENVDLKLRLVFSSPLEAEPYDLISGNFTIYLLGSSSEELLASNKAKSVFLGAYPTYNDYSITAVPESEKPFSKRILDARAAISRAVYRVLPDEGGALALALILGDKSGLSAASKSSFNAAGITHVICVSGFHLSLWAMLALHVFKKLGLGEKASSFFAGVAVVAFMFLAGFTYSVIRSGIMMLIYLLASILSRRRDPLNSLGFAIAAIAVVNPFALGAIGLQLSVLATLGIILYSQYVSADIQRLIRRIKPAFLRVVSGKSVGIIMTAISATAFTLPITMRLYGGFNFAVIPANFVAVPLAGVCMILCALGALIGCIPIGVFNIPAFLGGSISRFLIRFAKWIAGVDIFTFRIENDKAYVIIAAVLAVCALSVLMAYLGKPMLKVAGFACSMVFVAGLLVFSIPAKSETRLTVVDCGNGTVVLASCAGENILIGCGGTDFFGSVNISEAINSVGGRLDSIIVPDSGEHSSAWLNDVLAECRPDEIYYTSLPHGSSLLLADVEKYSFNEINDTEKFSLKSADVNNNYCVYLENQDISALICFDPMIELSELPDEFRNAKLLISRNDYPHGERLSQAEFAVINAENSRGILIQSELEEMGIKCAATGGCGNIVIRADSGSVSAYRE